MCGGRGNMFVGANRQKPQPDAHYGIVVEFIKKLQVPCLCACGVFIFTGVFATSSAGESKTNCARKKMAHLMPDKL